jgi:hypothetical protein
VGFAERMIGHGQWSDARAGCLGLQRCNLTRGVGNAAAAVLSFKPYLGLARNENFIEAFRLGAGAHALDQRIHAGAIVGLRDEQVRLERQEKVADVLRAVVGLVLVGDAAGES